MFRRKKVRAEKHSNPSICQEEETHETKDFNLSSLPETPRELISLLEKSSPQREKEDLPYLEEEKLRNTLYYLASLIPREKSWKCYFVDSEYHQGDITRDEGEGKISIRATLTKEQEQFILLPFGEKAVCCSFPPLVEFSFNSSYGEGKIEALHVCERSVHKLVFPEEIKIEGKEYPLQRVLPLTLNH